MINQIALSEDTKKTANELTPEEVSRRVSYAYQHEILWYGIDAVAHAYLMHRARDIREGKISLEEFARKFGLNFEDKIEVYDRPFFSGSLTAIEADSIFVPPQAYLNGEGNRYEKRVCFFHPDYRNRISMGSWTNKAVARLLTEKIWHPSDLEDPYTVEEGLKFGKDMWATCVVGFEEGKGPMYESQTEEGKFIFTKPQPQKVTDLGRRLIAYYSSIVFNL